MTVVIPMLPPDEAAVRVKEQSERLLERVREWIESKGGAPTGYYPLPWYAHENSQQLEFVGKALASEFDILITREHGCLGLRLTRKETKQ